MSILLILMLLLMLIKPYLTEFERLNIWVTIIQGYLGLVLALYLIFIHLYKVEMKNQQQQKDLEYLSFHDTLTGVYNRTYLNQLLTNQTLINEYPLVAVMMDMNNLKMINDTHGHDAGDYAIGSFAASIKLVIRKDDLVIRRSGDEFLLFMPNTDELKAKEIILQIKKQTESFSVQGIFLSISTGYAIMNDQHQNLNEIIQQADQAMYREKREFKRH
jgi:diguanylate cyclase (GGDEF)-like protein